MIISELEEVVELSTDVYPLFGCSTLSTGSRYYLCNRNDYVVSYCRQSKSTITKSNDDGIALFVDNVWPGCVVLADYLCNNYTPEVLTCMSSIELGAGCALPSLVLSRLGIGLAVITDYPADMVIENIEELIEKNNLLNNEKVNIIAKPHIWGTSVEEIRNELNGFDIVLVAECLWKDTYFLHADLLTSIKALLAKNGIVLVSFAHRPSLTKEHKHTKENDLEFFEKAQNLGLKVEQILSSSKYKDALEDDFVEVNLYMMKNI